MNPFREVKLSFPLNIRFASTLKYLNLVGLLNPFQWHFSGEIFPSPKEAVWLTLDLSLLRYMVCIKRRNFGKCCPSFSVTIFRGYFKIPFFYYIDLVQSILTIIPLIFAWIQSIKQLIWHQILQNPGALIEVE